MGTSDKAAAKRKRRNANLLDTQSLKSRESAANVDNGIDPTYLVKVDLIDGRIVNCGFCLADPGKDTSSGFLDLRGQGAVLNDLYDVGEVTLGASSCTWTSTLTALKAFLETRLICRWKSFR